MKEIKEILEQGVGKKFQLSRREKSRLWRSIYNEISVAPPVRHGSRRYIWYGVEALATAAILLGIFINTRHSTHSEAEIAPVEGVVTQALSQPETESIEKTMPVTIWDREGEGTPYNAPLIASISPTVAEMKYTVPEFIIDLSDLPTLQVPCYFHQDEEPASLQQEDKQTKQDVTKKRGKILYADYLPKIKKYAGNFLSASSNVTSGVGGSNLASQHSVAVVSVRGEEEKEDYEYNKVLSGIIENEDPSLIEPVSNAKYSLPINADLQFNYSLSRKFALGVGLSYSYISSKYDGRLNNTNYSVKQSAHYAGVHLNAYYTFGEIGNFNFYVSGGGAIQKAFDVQYQLSSQSEKKTLSYHVRGAEFSVNAGMGTEYRFGKAKQVGIYVEPNIIYYPSAKLKSSIRADQPLQIDAEIGIRLHLK